MARAFRLKTWKERPRYILINVHHEEIGRMSPEQSYEYYYILDMQNNNSEKSNPCQIRYLRSSGSYKTWISSPNNRVRYPEQRV